MNYTRNFKEVVNLNTYIGTGNPNSKILVIGKEVATDVDNGHNKELESKNLLAFNSNAADWKDNIKQNLNQDQVPNWNIESDKNNPLYAFKGIEVKKEGQTWRKYQKLHNCIFEGQSNNELSKAELNFQERFFITEMSTLPSKTTKEAQKKTDFKKRLQERKESFFKSDFIQDFPIVVLACSDYINGKEIEDIFDVKFIEKKGSERQPYWMHWNSYKTKLVIHTRQLSANVSNDLLSGIANEIRDANIVLKIS